MWNIKIYLVFDVLPSIKDASLQTISTDRQNVHVTAPAVVSHNGCNFADMKLYNNCNKSRVSVQVCYLLQNGNAKMIAMLLFTVRTSKIQKKVPNLIVRYEAY